MNRAPLIFLLAVLAGCGRGRPVPPGAPPPTDSQAAETAWRRWQAFVDAGDGAGAWVCLSKRSRSERAEFYKAEAVRVRGLSGNALEAEARHWGVPPAALATMAAEDFAAAALSRECRRPDGAGRADRFAGVAVKGEVAAVTVKRADGSEDRVALLREDSNWRLDDVESRRLRGR